MKKSCLLILFFGLVLSAEAVERKERSSASHMYFPSQSIAISLEAGAGIPLGDFSDSQFGNAEVGGVGAISFEYYFADFVSLGARGSGGIFGDDDDSDFSSRINNYQLFARFLVPVEGKVRPYGRFALGISTITYSVEDFMDLGTLTSLSDPGFSIGLDGGIVWSVSRLIGISGGVGYDVAFLESSEVEDSGFDVGYDVSYFSVNFGVSFFIQP
jgi:hypothetical protein